jgi:hypothetical protein
MVIGRKPAWSRTCLKPHQIRRIQQPFRHVFDQDGAGRSAAVHERDRRSDARGLLGVGYEKEMRDKFDTHSPSK